MGKNIPYASRIGQKIGKLTIVSIDGVVHSSARPKSLCTAECECGVVKQYLIESILTIKGAKSCGCARRIHGNSAISRTYGRYKNGASQRGYSFSLTRDHFSSLLSDNCHYCGSKPNTIASYNGQDATYNGIDRVDNEIGYEEGNVVTCCITCNRAKNNLLYQEFIDWTRGLASHVNEQRAIVLS